MTHVPKPPTHEERKLETKLQLIEEDEVAAHSTLSLLWKKVKTHAEWQDHIKRRDEALANNRTESARRASQLRKEKAAHAEAMAEEREKIAAEKTKQRLRVNKDPSVAEEELDMKKKDKKRKRKPLSEEKLAEISKQWVTVGQGGYNIADLDDPRYLRAMIAAEKSAANEHREAELEMRKKAAAEIRKNEKLIMHKKAGVTAKYHLPVKKSELDEKDDKENEEENDNNDDGNNDSENEFAGRKPIPGAPGCYMPEFHKSVGKAEKKNLIQHKKLLRSKATETQKKVDSDIDAAAKLLILHAHMIRKACVDAKEAAKKAKGDAEEES